MDHAELDIRSISRHQPSLVHAQVILHQRWRWHWQTYATCSKVSQCWSCRSLATLGDLSIGMWKGIRGGWARTIVVLIHRPSICTCCTCLAWKSRRNDSYMYYACIYEAHPWSVYFLIQSFLKQKHLRMCRTERPVVWGAELRTCQKFPKRGARSEQGSLHTGTQLLT